jgi:hypothetical protein
MTDIDNRYPSFREPKPTDVVLRLQCPECSQFTEITRAEEVELLKNVRPNYVSQSVVVECKCQKNQFILNTKQ